MAELFSDGDEVIIKGTITRSGGGSSDDVRVDDIYSSKESVVEQIGSDAIKVSSDIAKETVLSTAISQAQSIGASGVIALSSATYFQADAIVDNSREMIIEATPLVQEFNQTGTMTPPEGSKFSGQEIPKTKSFMGIKVGEGKKEVSAEEKALHEAFIKGAVPNSLNQGEKDGSSI